jgi:hypothetical protein
MFSVRIARRSTPLADPDIGMDKLEGKRLASSSSYSAVLAGDPDADVASEAHGDSLCFSVGNPRVEHITGLVHLYRSVPRREEQGKEVSSVVIHENGLPVSAPGYFCSVE